MGKVLNGTTDACKEPLFLGVNQSKILVVCGNSLDNFPLNQFGGPNLHLLLFFQPKDSEHLNEGGELLRCPEAGTGYCQLPVCKESG